MPRYVFYASPRGRAGVYPKRKSLMTVVMILTLALPAVVRAFDLTTATIADIQTQMEAGRLSSEQLVAAYLERVEAYDDRGPKVHTVITLNPDALAEARALDVERKANGPRSLLHGIPLVLKDNYDTANMPTTAGSSLLKDSIPPDDAYVVKKLRDAGAIILAKVNLSEFASGAGGPNGFSSMGGQTRNPHDLTKGPSGSSGGTGATTAAALSQFGLGSDTGGSIRGPSSANGIAGLKPTRGLMSRSGIVPLALSFDTGGPMARSVYDLAAALSVMAGVDPDDPATAASADHVQPNYTEFLKRGALKGARIGVARDFFGRDAGTDAVMETAIKKLRVLGAEVVDPVNFPAYLLDAKQSIYMALRVPEFKWQLNDYLATLGPAQPKTLAALIEKAEAAGSRYNNPWRLESMKQSQAAVGLDDPLYLAAKHEGLAMVTAAVLATFEKYELDAIVYPTSSRPARPIAPPAPGSAGGPSATNIANETGFPDVIVPAGMTPQGLPVTISFFGKAWSEPKLLSYAYDFEQATHARVLPKFTPPLASDRW